VRRLKVVASVALIAILASVAVPGPVGSWVPSPSATVDPDLFRQVEVAALAQGTPMTTTPQDPGARSAGSLAQGSTIVEPDLRTEPTPALVRPAQPAAKAGSISTNPGTDGNIRGFGPHLPATGPGGQTRSAASWASRTDRRVTLVTFRMAAGP
jgi:Tfp pilus assembly protein FimT